jgi:spermidine/putrescine transport system permease protein
MRSILGVNGFLNQILVGSGLLEKPSLVFLYNQTAILITMVVIFLPFVILPVFLSLERIPRNMIEASADLGAGSFRTLWHITLPLSLPGAIAGGLFTFVLALGDFVTPQMVGGPSGFTFGRVIWSQFGLAYNWPFGAAMGVVLLAVSLLIIIAAGLILRSQRV